MRRVFLVSLLLFMVCLHIIILGKAGESVKRLPQSDDSDFVIPSPVLKIMSLEFQGVVSDVLFLKSMGFIGGASERKESPKVKAWEWEWFAKVLDITTDLDPYFLDPYLYANAFLPWDAGKTEEANRLLEKGNRYRNWDWRLPFYIGFNNFFFLHNDGKASEYLMEASRRPGGDPLFASIAARLAFKENRTENALYFLEELTKNSEDMTVKKRYEIRIKALRSIVVLEKGIDLYKKKLGRTPANVDELVKQKILSQLPQDPYGGSFYITKDGKIRSSSRSELEPYLSPLAKSLH